MTWTPWLLTFSGRWFVDGPPCLGDVGGGQVGQTGVWPVVVGVDVVTDVVARLFDGFGFGSPGTAFLELSESGLDEGL